MTVWAGNEQKNGGEKQLQHGDVASMRQGIGNMVVFYSWDLIKYYPGRTTERHFRTSPRIYRDIYRK